MEQTNLGEHFNKSFLQQLLSGKEIISNGPVMLLVAQHLKTMIVYYESTEMTDW